MKWFGEVMKSQIRLQLAYPWGFWISLGIELFVVASINWFLWTAVIAARGGESFAEFSFKTLVLYSLITSILRKTQMGFGQFGGLGDDIYSGALNKYLVYPVPYFGIRYAMHLGGSLLSFVQSFVALLLFWLIFAWNEQALPHSTAILQFVILVAIAVTLRFLINVWLQCLCFWFEQVWALLVMVSFLIMLLGGQMLPMSLYPDWARDILAFSPFPILAAWPAEALLGKMSWHSFFRSIVVGFTWIGIFFCFATATFNRGIRHYSGIGA